MMYSFAQRKDTTVVDEPFYANYLKTTGIDHPGKDEVLASQENDGKKVIENIILGGYDTQVVFFKQMTHHLIYLDLSFLHDMKNIMLIRDPKKVLYSYSKVIEQPTLEGIGIKKSFELYEYLEKYNAHYIIIDADNFLKDPEVTLRKICEGCEIEFDINMLHWQAGARKEDGVWAKYWYANVHQSTGFEKYKETEIILPQHLLSVYNEAKKYYDILKNIELQ
ncbi:MAG: sulfotransferase family protein [Fimbriimonadaceae bacterium]|nr:sulfotransferase family protein [Chitinophagales bacterium]